MSEFNPFKLLLPEEARKISQVNSFPKELERVVELIKSSAASGQYKLMGISVKEAHMDAVAANLRDAGYIVKQGHAGYDKRSRGLNISWEDIT